MSAADRVESAVRAARAGMRRSRLIGSAVRGSLYASLASAAFLTATKFTGWPRAALAAALVVPLAAMVRAAWTRIDLREAAAAVDRVLGLEERVATALECARGGGALAPAAVDDAARALDRAGTVPAVGPGWPAEGRFLLPAVLLVGMLWIVPGRHDAAVAAVGGLASEMESEARALDRAARTADPALARKVRELLGGLSSSDPARARDAAVSARELAVALRTDLARGAADPGGLRRELAERLEAAGSAAARGLARRGVTVPAVEPQDLEARAIAARSRADQGGASGAPSPLDLTRVSGGAAVSAAVSESVARRLAAPDWDRTYDVVVGRYYGLPGNPKERHP